MVEIELSAGELAEHDNTLNVEMSKDEIWFLKNFIKEYNPKKIVEIGVSAGGNTVNLLQWKDKDAELFSVDIATNWWKDNSKLSGFMAEELNIKDNWKIFRGYDYIDVYDEIGNDIDCIIIDTTHFLPGEFLTFIAALPQLKDGCIVVLHDIHLNMFRFFINQFETRDIEAFCTGLLFGGVSSKMKWTLKSKHMSNIGAFVIDKTTRDNIKDIFHILCTTWHSFPSMINFIDYLKFVYENYSIDCYNLFNVCLKLQSQYFDMDIYGSAENARVDIVNMNNEDNAIEILNAPNFVDVNYPSWFKRKSGEGVVLQTSEKLFKIKLKCINDGILKIHLKGPYARNNSGRHVPRYIDFVNFKVNQEDIIKENVVVWHDDPYIFEKTVEDGEIIEIQCEWTYYEPPTIPF